MVLALGQALPLIPLSENKFSSLDKNKRNPPVSAIQKVTQDFLEKAHLLISKQLPESIGNKNSILDQVVNFGLKGYLHPDVSEAQVDYAGLFCYHHFCVKFEIARQLLERIVRTAEKHLSCKINQLKDRISLLRICLHRFNFSHYELLYRQAAQQFSLIERKRSILKIIKKIQDNIDALDNPFHPHVVALKNGSTCFSKPGGWFGHSISFQFRKENKKYYFIINNRGTLCTDTRLHGNFSFEKGGKEYKKTVVWIQVQKTDLKDANFLKILLTAPLDNSVKEEFTYNKLYQFLIDQGRGQLVYTEIDKFLNMLQKLLENDNLDLKTKGEVRQTIYKLIKQDPTYQSQQMMGSCPESNHTACEKEMASPFVRRTLKYFTLQTMLENLKAEYFTKKPLQKSLDADFKKRIKDAKLIYHHTQIKLRKLKSKIALDEKPKVLSHLEIQNLLAKWKKTKTFSLPIHSKANAYFKKRF